VSARLSILIAEDSAADRMLLSTIVSRQGHRVLTAANGLEALALFEQERPQLVLMDALMPIMDGFEAARRIKLLAGEALVPIIFLTSLTEGEALVRCLEAGGDDFLAKPYNRVILEAKINAMDRLRRLQETVLQQRDLIARNNAFLLDEQRAAKAVFDKVAHAGCLDAPNVRYLQSPYALFNGDLLLAAFQPSGDMHVLLGDFTGHGLPAAIGAMPLAEAFYGMTAKGHSLREVLREVNAKLKRILPMGMFCCATLLNISFQRKVVEVWAGGLPDGYLLRGDGREHTPLVSRHLPLGVRDARSFNDALEVYPLEMGDRVLLLSDGVLEGSNAEGELFGEQRLLEVLAANRDDQALFDEIQAALIRFRGTQQDDISLVEIGLVEPTSLGRPPVPQGGSVENAPLDWSATFEYRGATLCRHNPVPQVLQLLLEVPGLRLQAGALFSVLTELYANALEHGVLGLDSAMKADARGFADYYRLRTERLAALVEGYVRFDLRICPEPGGGRLTLLVDDSGPGFDGQAVMDHQAQPERFSGRGLALVRQLSERCTWPADGRGVSVEFSWRLEA
jgi:CheY-like chemotaxis protein